MNVKTFFGSVSLQNIYGLIILLYMICHAAVYLSRSNAVMVDGTEIIDTRQFPGHLGVTIELCAGIVDKDLPAVEIAKAEVVEECGYNVPLSSFRKITSCR